MLLRWLKTGGILLMIRVVGIGPGETSYMTQRGKKLIEEAELVIGANRHLEEWKHVAKETMELPALSKLIDFLKEYKEEVVVLASGDPLTYGIGKYLVEKLGTKNVEIVSGISSMQYFFSKIPMDMNDLYITSGHGKDPNFDMILNLSKVAMVTDEKWTPQKISREIIDRNLKKIIYVGENLSYPDEKITVGSPSEILNMPNFDMNVVVIIDA